MGGYAHLEIELEIELEPRKIHQNPCPSPAQNWQEIKGK
jgi:hypothetical protein